MFVSMIPNQTKIPNFSLYLFVYIFWNIIMTGEHTFTTSKEGWHQPKLMFHLNASQLSITDLKVKWPFRFTFKYVQPIRKTVPQMRGKAPLQPIQTPQRIWTIHESKLLKIKVVITLCFHLLQSLQSAATNEEQYQKRLCNQSSHHRKYGR